MYDSGSYMGSVCILDAPPDLLEDPETRQELAELGRVPYSARRFFTAFQDRILFGTDSTPVTLGAHPIYYSTPSFKISITHFTPLTI